MFGDIIVPLDGSDRSALAVGPAGAMARFLDSKVKLVGYAPPGDEDELRTWVGAQAHRLGPVGREVIVDTLDGTVAAKLVDLVEAAPADLVCMSTHGRGRSAAVVGSVADELLAQLSGPVMLLGPSYREHRFRCHGNLVAALDGTRHSEAIVPVVESFAIVFGFDAAFVTVVDPDAGSAFQMAGSSGTELVVESNYVHRIARQAGEAIGREAQFEVLHGTDPARAILDQVDEMDAPLVAMATHGASGLRRLISGSVTADVVRHAPCPVLAVRPAHLAR